MQKVLTDIKTLLGAEPDNAAAKAAQTLTETQLKDLRQIYFNHQADAGANYRAALEANGGMEKPLRQTRQRRKMCGIPLTNGLRTRSKV